MLKKPPNTAPVPSAVHTQHWGGASPACGSCRSWNCSDKIWSPQTRREPGLLSQNSCHRLSARLSLNTALGVRRDRRSRGANGRDAASEAVRKWGPVIVPSRISTDTTHTGLGHKQAGFKAKKMISKSLFSTHDSCHNVFDRSTTY